ncbi:MAG: MauE/DoxX family redox-associated membrane protein [Halioglobus sp.]
MDPVFTHIVALGLSILFLAAGLQKLRLRDSFEQVLSGYQLLPAATLALASRVIPLVELALAAGLAYPDTRAVAAIGAALLLCLYATSIWINLKRGNIGLDCGCQLGESKQTISYALVYRNALLASVALLLIAPQSTREVALYDYGATGFGIAIACLLYAIANTQIANASSFREINR